MVIRVIVRLSGQLINMNFFFWWCTQLSTLNFLHVPSGDENLPYWWIGLMYFSQSCTCLCCLCCCNSNQFFSFLGGGGSLNIVFQANNVICGRHEHVSVLIMQEDDLQGELFSRAILSCAVTFSFSVTMRQFVRAFEEWLHSRPFKKFFLSCVISVNCSNLVKWKL